MKTLSIWDVDDTIVMVDVHIDVLDESGEVVERLFAAEFYERVEKGELEAAQCSFHNYKCADTFYNHGKINEHLLPELIRQLNDPEVDVFFVTARDPVTCNDTYMRKFHDHGALVSSEQVFFCKDPNADPSEHTHTYLMKTPVYQKLIDGKIYNRVIGYEDNPRNLQAIHEICVDNDVPFKGYVVQADGTVRDFTAADL